MSDSGEFTEDGGVSLDEINFLVKSVSELWNQITEDIYSLDEIEDLLSFEIILGIQYALGVIKEDCVLKPEGFEFLKSVHSQLLSINQGLSE